MKVSQQKQQMQKNTIIIAEAGVNHNGSIALAKKLIEAAKASGADAVKFQTFRTESVVSIRAGKAEYQKKTTDNNESQFEMAKKLELNESDHRELIAHCRQVGIAFLSSPFDEESAEMLARLGIEQFKVASGEITNLPFLEFLARMKEYEIVGFVSRDKVKGDKFRGYQILGQDEVLLEYKEKGVDRAVIGVGGYKDNSLRAKIYFKIKSFGFQIVNAIHPSATISPTVSMGDGVVVFPGVIINTDVKVGNNVIIATGASVDHETIIEDHVLISAGVTVGGYNCIQEGALLALGSKVISGIKIGKNAFVAAGAVVVKDIGNNERVFGIPAKIK